MTIRLYLDEDSMDHDLVDALRLHSVDATTPAEVGMMERSDEAHLLWAATEGRVLYSFNMQDFCRLHNEYLSSGKTHAGLILAQQQRYRIGEQMRRLLRLINRLTAEEMVDRIEFLNAWGER